MKQPVRSFSIGLFVAGIIMLIGVYFFDGSSKGTEEQSIESMISNIEEEGYRVVTEEEYISVSVNKDSEAETEDNTENDSETQENIDEDSEDENTTEEEEKEEEETPEQDTDVTYTLTIESGMLSPEISTILEENQIINDSSEFTQYLDKEDYGPRVQIGEYELSSDMSFYEIAEEITK